jgi:CheY-like chemotaxis protein
MVPRILVVDDEPTIRALVVRTLQEDGYDVVALADGMTGLEVAMRYPFDLVVTNDCMPRMSGDELTVRLHQLYPRLPILHISGRPHDEAEDIRTGEYHLDKPFGPDALQQAVRTLLGDRVRQ